MTSLQILRLHKDVLLPRRGTERSVGLDVHAYLISETGRANTFLLPPHTTRMIPTGLALKPPEGYAVLCCSRSGMASKGIFVTNSPGVIDPDYRGEIKILLHNGGHTSYWIKHEDRIAQLLIIPTPLVAFEEVEELDSTERGSSGFGSTGD